MGSQAISEEIKDPYFVEQPTLKPPAQPITLFGNQGSGAYIQWIPKQKLALQSVYENLYTLYGGARGGAKSFWLRWGPIHYLIYLFKKLGLRNIHGMLACETYPELQDRQISKLEVEFPHWLGEVKSTQANGLGVYLHPEYGSSILKLRNLDDVSKYQSAEFAVVAIEELTKNLKGVFDVIRGSMRWPGVPHIPFMGATNPGSVGHRWVKELWIDKNYTAYPELLKHKDEFSFVQSLPSDNPHLTSKYWDMLNTLPAELRKAWVLGDWSVFEGQAFTGFSRATHVIKTTIELPEHWPRWRGVDWGFAKPFCCLWACKNPDTGGIYIYRELYLAGLTDRQQAKLILENTPPSERITITYADPSMWGRKNVDNIVTSTAEEYATAGVVLTRADNDRLSRKRKVDRLLMPLPNGLPGLLIFEQCANLIKTLENLVYSETHPEDVDTDQEDHAYDALGYGLTNTKIKVQEKRAPQKSDVELASSMF